MNMKEHTHKDRYISSLWTIILRVLLLDEIMRFYTIALFWRTDEERERERDLFIISRHSLWLVGIGPTRVAGMMMMINSAKEGGGGWKWM